MSHRLKIRASELGIELGSPAWQASTLTTGDSINGPINNAAMNRELKAV